VLHYHFAPLLPLAPSFTFYTVTTIGWLYIFKIQVENCFENTSTSDCNNGKLPSGATRYGNELPQLVFCQSSLIITCQFLSWIIPGVPDHLIPDCGNLVCIGHHELTNM